MNFHSFSNADLHVHSKYSDRPSEWFLRRIGAPESFVEPLELYRHCTAHGMDFVTIADHNSISGALEIAHLPNTFLSSELTTYFPEDQCKIHMLVCGVTEAQFTELDYLRKNIFDLREYMLDNDIIHSVNHPLYSVNGRMSIAHFEQLLVMFKRFEAINGTRNPVAFHVARAIYDALTPERIEAMADHHGIEPRQSEPWKKVLLGGSDDHSGCYAASAWTRTPVSADVDEFLGHIRDGRAEPAGSCGSCLKFANSLINIATSYVSSRFMGQDRKETGSGVLGAMLRKLSSDERHLPRRNRVQLYVRKVLEPMVRRHRARSWSQSERDLVDDLQEIFANFNNPDSSLSRETPHERNFRMASRAAHELSFRFFQRFLRKIKSGSIISAVESMAALSPVVLGVAPYLTSYKTQHRDDALIRDLVAHFNLENHVRITSGRKAWLTDTFSDINGVSLTIRTLASLAYARNRNLTVITSLEQDEDVDFDHANFAPIGMFSLPEYPQQKLAFPPVLDIINYIEREQFDELIVSTPGPVGLCGILAARLLNIPIRGIYHTDFPRYIQEWTDDDTMCEMATRAMKWFYGQMTSIYAPTHAYVEELRGMGFSGRMLSVLPRGVNMEQFNPSFRDHSYWARFGLNGSFKFVYVGRVAYEKNLKALLDAWKLLTGRGIAAELAVVGDGPHLKEVQKEYGRVPGLVFTGFMQGEELSRAYAAADALVFPSLTDTFGNVVLEAHASGLPAIVSDRGGPQEIVRSHESGLVVDAANPERLADAMQRLVSDTELYAALKLNATRSAETRNWDTVLDKLENPQFVE